MPTEHKKFSSYQLVVFALIFIGAIGVKLWSYHMPTSAIILKGERLEVLLARTPSQQYRGLGGRNDLGDADGMLFVFPEAARTGFVMRDMEFSIDMVWFSKGEVVDIAPSVPLEPGVAPQNLRVYYPRKEADLFLELPAGWAAAHGLVIGDTLTSVEGPS